MDSSSLSLLLSVFDFRSGPKPVYCFPQNIDSQITAKISFKGHLILSKVAKSDFQSFGLYIPFFDFSITGFVYMFQIPTDPSYARESTYCLLSLLTSKDNSIPLFSLKSEFLSSISSLTSAISSNVQYAGEISNFLVVEELLQEEQVKLNNIFVQRTTEINNDNSDNKDFKKNLSDFLSKSKDDLDQLLYGLLIDFNKKILIFSPKEDFCYSIIESLHFLTPHRSLNIEFAGKGEMKVEPEIIVCSDFDFYDLQADFFDISINYKAGKIISLDYDRNNFVREIADFLLKNKNDPALINHLLKSEINKLLDKYFDFILVAGALTDQERDEQKKKILENEDRDLIRGAYTLATYINPSLKEIRLL